MSKTLQGKILGRGRGCKLTRRRKPKDMGPWPFEGGW